MTKRFGFTLAEVLITLGIIGVVAAMTMPTLMNSTQGAQYKTAFKKSLSALSQAVTLNMALDDWNFADVDADSTDYTLNKILTTRMNVIKNEAVASGDYITKPTVTANQTGLEAVGTGYQRVSFADGITFFYKTADEGCTDTELTAADGETPALKTNKCYGVVDVNGEKGPNKYVSCDTATDNIMDDITASITDESKYKAGGTCTVTNPTDIYPVYYYDQTVVPASAAAKAVLYGK